MKSIEIEDMESFGRHRTASVVSPPTASSSLDTKTADDMEKLRIEMENIFSPDKFADFAIVSALQFKKCNQFRYPS